MALTKNEWAAKIRKFVPSWWFQSDVVVKALFDAASAIFSRVDNDIDDSFAATFILESTSPTLDVLGDERGTTRNSGEADASYAIRVQQITSKTDKPDIQAVIDALLLNPPCVIQEAPFDNAYFHRNAYCKRGNRFSEFRRNYFLIIVPSQHHAQYSFFGRNAYMGRLSFIGSSSSTSTILTSVISAVDKMKAFGVMYGIVEKS
jgi:hypothetical protein